MGRRRRATVSISLFSFQDIITCLSGVMILLVLLISLDIATQKLSVSSPEHPASINPSVIDGIADANPAVNGAEQQNPLIQSRIALEHQRLDIERKKIAVLMREEELTHRLLELKTLHETLSRNNTITLLPDQGSDQTPLVVECSGEIIRWGGSISTNKNRNKGKQIKGKEHVKKEENENGKYKRNELFSTDGNGIQQFLNALATVSKIDDYILFMIKPSASDYAMQLIGQVRQMGFDVGYDAMIEEQTVSFEYQE